MVRSKRRVKHQKKFKIFDSFVYKSKILNSVSKLMIDFKYIVKFDNFDQYTCTIMK